MRSWLPGIGNETDSPLANHKETEGQGFFSPMTKVYIGDVTDHLETVVSSMDQLVATCDHLTDYVFVSCDGDGSGIFIEAEDNYRTCCRSRQMPRWNGLALSPSSSFVGVGPFRS